MSIPSKEGVSHQVLLIYRHGTVIVLLVSTLVYKYYENTLNFNVIPQIKV